MNQLLMVGVLVGIAVVGIVFIMGAAANPSGAVTGKVIQNSKVAPIQLPPVVDGKQDVFLKATQRGGYNPNYLVVKKGIPVRVHFSSDPNTGCGREVIFPSFNVQQLAPNTGEAIVEFTPQDIGKFPYNCPMRMFRGTIEVVA